MSNLCEGQKDNCSPCDWGTGTQRTAWPQHKLEDITPSIPTAMSPLGHSKEQCQLGAAARGSARCLSCSTHVTLEVNKSPQMWALLTWLQALEFAEDHRNNFNGSELALISQGLPAEQGFAWRYKAAPAGWERQKWPSAGRLDGIREQLRNKGLDACLSLFAEGWRSGTAGEVTSFSLRSWQRALLGTDACSPQSISSELGGLRLCQVQDATKEGLKKQSLQRRLKEKDIRALAGSK